MVCGSEHKAVERCWVALKVEVGKANVYRTQVFNFPTCVVFSVVGLGPAGFVLFI